MMSTLVAVISIRFVGLDVILFNCPCCRQYPTILTLLSTYKPCDALYDIFICVVVRAVFDSCDCAFISIAMKIKNHSCCLSQLCHIPHQCVHQKDKIANDKICGQEIGSQCHYSVCTVQLKKQSFAQGSCTNRAVCSCANRSVHQCALIQYQYSRVRYTREILTFGTLIWNDIAGY